MGSMLSSFLLIRWRKEKERGHEENGKQALALWESGWCVTLAAVNVLLWRINYYDRVPPLRVTGRIFLLQLD